MQIASMDLKVVEELFFEITILSLILRSYWRLGSPMVVDYILEINLTKRKKYLRMVLFTFNGPV